MALYQLTVGNVGVYIDELVSNLEGEFQYSYDGMNISEIIKGGSLGHGTAVPSNFDLDLVVYSRDIDPNDVLRNGVRNILRKFDSYLRRKYDCNYSLDGMTPFALQFTLYGQLEVDLLPSPYWNIYSDYVKFIAPLTPADRRKLQCSESKWEKSFFQNQPNEVKEYIKRAKAWRNRIWPKHMSKGGRPKSFLLGLLVAKAYDQCGTVGYRKDAYSVGAQLKRMVQGHSHLCVYWSGRDVPYADHILHQYNLLRPPCIIDPANPFNNVYYSGISYYQANSRIGNYDEGDGNWTAFVKEIGSLDLANSVY